MTETRGVFSLSDLYDLKVLEEWIPLDEVWISPSRFFAPPPDTGYFGGGDVNDSERSTMDKVTYASDTTAAVPGAALTSAKRMLAATSNSTHGYFAGGTSPGYVSTMDKTTYASDTTAAVPGAALSAARYGVAASSARANALPTIQTGPVIV